MPSSLIYKAEAEADCLLLFKQCCFSYHLSHNIISFSERECSNSLVLVKLKRNNLHNSFSFSY